MYYENKAETGRICDKSDLLMIRKYGNAAKNDWKKYFSITRQCKMYSYFSRLHVCKLILHTSLKQNVC